MSTLENLIRIVEKVRIKITAKTDVQWTDYESSTDLQIEIEKDLNELRNGNLSKLETFKIHFLPTGTFQEISISNGWAEEFLKLAKDYDNLYDHLKK